jgi:hypothetical protein
MPKGRTSKRKDNISISAGAELLGITPAQFRRLMERRKIEPTDWYTNPNHRSGPPCPLWPIRRVRALVGKPAVEEVRERSQKLKVAKQTAPAGRRERLARRYPDPHQAIPAAAEALFSLNRYTKRSRCNREHRDEIYALKSDLVRLLYARGYASDVHEHHRDRPGRLCRRGCRPMTAEQLAAFDAMPRVQVDHDHDTSRLHSHHNDDEGEWFDDVCRRCEGTGWYRRPGTDVFVVFHFQVEGQFYCWHQPVEWVDWPYEVTAEAQPWSNVQEEKPIVIPARKFANAKALIRFVVDECDGGKES